MDKQKLLQKEIELNLIKRGFKPEKHIDDKTGKPFICWAKNTVLKRGCVVCGDDVNDDDKCANNCH